jgi:hypothetical protein
LNKLLQRDETFSQISRHRERDGDRFELRPMRRWRSPESLLLPVGEALAKFVCEEDFAHVKACEGHKCTLAICRPYAHAGETMVQHGDLRQSRQTSRASQPAQEQAVTS